MKYFLFLFVILFLSCNKSKEDAPNELLKNPIHQINIDTDLEDRFQLSKVISKIEYVNLESNIQCAIGEVQKITVSNNRVYILDTYISKGLFCFNMSGKFLFKIAQQGKGPGELLYPKDFLVTKSRIEILDYYKKSILFYNLDGKYIDMIRPNVYIESFAKLDENQYVITPNYRIFKSKNNYNLMITNKDFVVNKKYFKIREKFADISFKSAYQFYNTGDNSLLLKFEYSNSIYSFENSIPYLKYKLKFDGSEIENIDVNGNRVDMNKLIENQTIYGVKEIIEVGDLLYFQYMISARGASCFYNTDTKEVYKGAVDNDIDGFPFASVVIKQGLDIVGIVNPTFILTASESPNYKYKTKKLKNFAKNINELTNYIIAVYTLK